MDLTALSDDELARLVSDAATEQLRREQLAELPAQIDRLVDAWQDAAGLGQGEAWKAPTGAHDAYRQGAVVTHNGKTWESLIPANVWEPGVTGWRELVPEGAGPAEWVQPTGSHDAYQTGDVVSFEGRVYRSLIDSNVWSPASYPAGWEEIA